jgi:hypothetical protein
MIAVRKRNAAILRSDSGAPYVTLATRLHTKGNSPSVRILFFAALVFAVVLSSCGSRKEPTEQASPVAETNDVNGPLASFSEDIQSSVKSLSLRPAESTLVPVTLRNTGPVLWSPTGRNPITISYKWFDQGKMLPIEGERTGLPRPVKPGESLDVQVKVVAPGKAGDLVLKVSLVQEGVAWFMTSGTKPLELPVNVH